MEPAAATSVLTPSQRILRALRGSVVVRTTLAILGLSALVGVLATAAGTLLLEGQERERQYTALRELLGTVERTASIAAFTSDAALANEVARGLLQNRAVAGVSIRSGEAVLARVAREGFDEAAPVARLERSLMSPFVAGEIVGTIELLPAIEQIRHAAVNYSRFIALILGLEVSAVACAVAWVVFSSITRPIKRVSDDLHHLELQTGEQLLPPRGSEHDEIGRLVGDVNALIARMATLLVTERTLRAEHARAERKFRLIFENAETGIFVLDEGGYLQSWNPAMVRILSADAFNSIGMPPRLAALFGSSAGSVDELVARTAAGDRALALDLPCGQCGGRWVSVVLNPVGDGQLHGVINDITERKRSEANARELAERDALTGLLNRRGFERLATHALAAATPESGAALLLIDLDGFKQVNDTQGHDAGDTLLIHVARVLEALVRRSDILARFGGDEFVVQLIGISDPATARRIAQNIVAALSRPFALESDRPVRIGASVGVVVTFGPDDSLDDVLRRADAAMYQAKRSGKAQFRIAEPA